MSWQRWVLGSSILVLLAGAWISGELRTAQVPPLPRTSTERDELPEEFAVGELAATAFMGEQLVIAEQSSADGARVVAIDPDGTVAELPEAPGMSSRTLVSDGSSVVLVGGACDDEGCAAPLEAHRLSRDRRRWERIEVPDLEIWEAGIEQRGGTPGHPLVWSTAGWLTLHDGRVVELDSSGGRTPRSATTCATSVTATAFNVGDRRPLSSRTLEPDDRWRRVDAPGGPPTDAPVSSVVCTDDAVLLLGHGEEHRFDGESWSTGPGPELDEVVPDRLLSWGTAPDGTLHAVATNSRRVLQRGPDGGWTDTDGLADHVEVSPDGRVWLLPAHGDSIEVIEPS
jgi:hypothetical protein